MGLKNFDYKQLLIDRGERIGLGAAGVITLCLVASLFIPGMGFLSGSASSNADALTSAANTVQTGLNSNKPTGADLPGDTKEKLVAFNFDIIDHKKAEEYSIAEIFMPKTSAVASRQMPDLMQPKDSRAAVVRFQMPSFVFDTDYKQILVLDDAPSAGSGSKMMPGTPNVKALSELYSKAGGGQYNPMGLNTVRPRHKITHKGDGTDQEDFKSHFEDIGKIASINDKKLAEAAYPVRAAEIVASFPYKAQVEEFRDKLGLAVPEQVLAEQSQEVGKDKQVLPAFRFLGVRLERRQVDAQGKPIDAQGKRVDDKAGWAEINLEDSFKSLMILDGKRFEDEDPKLVPVEVDPHLVMRKLLTFGDRRTPPIEEYPKIEEEMPDLKATIEAINKDPNAVVGAPALISKDFSVFDADVGSTASPTMSPGGSTTPMRPMPGGSIRPGGSTPPGGLLRPSFAAGDGPGKTPFGGDMLQKGQTLTIPDYILIRLFDVTVEPGKTYEYRMQVRMANPNRDRTDAASQGFAHLPELPAKDSWYVLPEKVQVPLDVNYYAVDQAKIDASAPKEPKDPSQPKEPKAPVQAIKENQIALQIQKWVETLKTKREEQPIGDWVIAERVVATRGEPIAPQKVEVPYWRKTQDRFTLLSDGPSKSGRRGPPTVEVSFMDGDEPILVDFTGGDVTYKRTRPDAAAGQAAPVTDKGGAVDVLLLMPDGTLAARDSAVDAADAKRVSRVKEYRDFIRDVKNTKGGKEQTTPFGTPPVNNINN